MAYIQIGSINFENIESPELREWLENLDDELNIQFVEILDGDVSLVRQCGQELISAEEILDNYDDFEVSASKFFDAEFIEKMDARRERAHAYWDSDIVWRPVGE